METEQTEQLAREVARLRRESEQRKQQHGVPALLSFFIPGLGQLIKGHVAKGILIFIGMVVSGIACAYMIGFLTTPIVWVWQIYDAYKSPD